MRVCRYLTVHTAYAVLQQASRCRCRPAAMFGCSLQCAATGMRLCLVVRCSSHSRNPCYTTAGGTASDAAIRMITGQPPACRSSLARR
ncbi:hypothetical protein CONLIGDRAFT_429564 [Coniochaeta ligniaria NRRL 30616]|uniref:Uncharacterized protein n=1 Tax=Coniochaeta ligniaria NRRL 30616 TaxID=1408157 RepID=A0A1J7II91_9PEZI|nr:hypothetical protein CONLIGDRAFT_429564 [Coniochaeta ligniaria NRRL 30616]